MLEALYYHHLQQHDIADSATQNEDTRLPLIQCDLCPHFCVLKPGASGRCGARIHLDGKLFTTNYGFVSALAIDPIEKKPLKRWYPGTEILSFSTLGCNMSCPFCQNYGISMVHSTVHALHLSTEAPLPSGCEPMTPSELVALAIQQGVPAIAYTYNEPTVFYEMVLETAMLARAAGLRNVLVTNGLINEAPLLALLPYIDAMNIDVKAPTDALYKKLGAPSLDCILHTLEVVEKYNHNFASHDTDANLRRPAIHVELTHLLVPGICDDLDKMEVLWQRLQQINPDYVIHLTRYYPRYHYDEPATTIEMVAQAQLRAKKYFRYVYGVGTTCLDNPF